MKIAVIMGSDSDLEVVKGTLDVLKAFDVAYDVRVLSAHRTIYQTLNYIEGLEEHGVELVIGAAGKAAHLPGVIAGATILPVIGLPIKSSTLDGMDALLSIVQMPSGVPVATVAINGAKNAGLLAVQILSVKYPELKEKLVDYKKTMVQEVLAKDSKLQASVF